MTVFHYTAKEWKPIAVLLDGWSMETKEAIELIINAYRKAPTADEQRARIAPNRRRWPQFQKLQRPFCTNSIWPAGTMSDPRAGA